MNEGAQRSVFEGIGHDVINLDTRFARMKKMLVVPNPVGSQPLLVNKKRGASTWVISDNQLIRKPNSGVT